jgi:hypothetical protein
LLSNEQKYLAELLKNLELIGVRLTKSIIIQLASDYVQRITSKVVNRKFLASAFFSQHYYLYFKQMSIVRPFHYSFFFISWYPVFLFVLFYFFWTNLNERIQCFLHDRFIYFQKITIFFFFNSYVYELRI